MIIAYAVILVGGLLITRRLRLLAAAATFWIALAVGVGILAASGHCMTARWAFAPVCGFDYWRVIVTSPEVLIFLFFMITDPKTVPAGRVGRVVFGLLVAVASTLLMAPQTDEFGTKVALLGGLVVVCAARPLVDRLVPEPRIGGGRSRPVRDPARDRRRRWRRDRSGPAQVLSGGADRVPPSSLVGVGIVVAGTPARGVVVPGADDVLGRVPHDVDPATFPTISVEQGVVDWNHEIVGPGAQAIVLTLAENLELESQALLRADATILTAVDHGDRLDDMRARLDDAVATGTTVIERYQIDDVHVTLLVPFGRQDGLSLGLESRGTVTTETYDAGRRPAGSSVIPVRHDVRPPPGDRRTLAQRRRTAARRRRLTPARGLPAARSCGGIECSCSRIEHDCGAPLRWSMGRQQCEFDDWYRSRSRGRSSSPPAATMTKRPATPTTPAGRRHRQHAADGDHRAGGGRRLRGRRVLEQLPGGALGQVGRAGAQGGHRGRWRHVHLERRQVVGRDAALQHREPDLPGRQRARGPRPGRHGRQARGRPRAIGQGVPVIAYDRLIEDAGALYITFDNVKVGELEAQAVFDLVPEGRYVIVKGNSADANADFLRDGLRDGHR